MTLTFKLNLQCVKINQHVKYQSGLSAMDFVVNRFFMKLFRTNNIETVKSCQYYFNFQPPSLLWSERVKSLIMNMTYLLVVCLQYKLSTYVNKCCHCICIGLHCSHCNFVLPVFTCYTNFGHFRS